MLRPILVTLSLFTAASTAAAHFVFVVPDKGGQTAKVILSEDLQPDDGVPIEVIAATKLLRTDAAGHDLELKLEKADHAYTVQLAGDQAGVIHGISRLGVSKHGGSKPTLLSYYPKTVIGDPFDPKARLGNQAPIELIAIGQAGKLKLQLLTDSKITPDAEVDVILPDGSDQKVKTDKEGNTPVFTASGRYGAWARHVEVKAGEQDGRHYDEVRQYATLVIDIAQRPAPPASASRPTGPTAANGNPPSIDSSYAPLPQAASSFGAVACDGWLYVYGGHIVDTHSYSTASVSGQFHRLNLADHQTWEELPGGPALQGLNLATWHGKIYRVGGMNPRNKPGDEADVRSVADCASFDPATKKWTPLPSLPDPRSSHDLAVVGDKLIVAGGWNLTGDADEAHWLDTALVLDLSAAEPQWKSVAQPFRRRALIAASYRDRMYVIGGFETESEPSKRVDIYNPATNTWSTGPELPGADKNGFGPAACTLDDKLYVSVADGTLYRLSGGGTNWEKIAATTPRIVHRLVPNGTQVLVIGGAAKKKQLNLIEAVNVVSASAQSAGPAANAPRLHSSAAQPADHRPR